MFEGIANCPLTGVPLNGRATFEPLNGSAEVLYTFEVIGCVIFKRNDLLDLLQLIKDGFYPYDTNLASLCREAYERGEPIPVMTNDTLYHSEGKFPVEFEEKQMHFLRLLYDIGGRERRSRTIRVKNDFTLAFAQDADQFYRILESLLDEGLLRYDENSVVRGDFEGDIQICYPDMLLTPAGKRAVKEAVTLPGVNTAPQLVTLPIPSSIAALHPTIQQAAGSLFATGHYRQALLDAYIAVDTAVREKSQLTGSGTRLMEVAFSPGNPVIKIGDSPDEQQGFLSLFRGAMLAIRNPKAHSLHGTHDAQRALEWLSFASVLLRNLDEALLAQPTTTPPTLPPAP